MVCLPRPSSVAVSSAAAACLALGLASGCAADTAAPSGPALAIAVAPLSLPGIGDACYGLSVSNAEGDTVWSEAPICASQYGNSAGGDISYVGTCDATDPGTGAWNTVTLTIEGLYTPGGGTVSGWVNPCAAPHAPDGCQLRVLCTENSDTPVAFNLTIMRKAGQGFFDIAVDFDDIFCSAKVDCTDPLVFDPDTGKRVDSIVLGFACTDGDPASSEAASTHLYLDDLVITCVGPSDTTSYPVDPTLGPGNLYPGGVGAPAPLVQAMTFTGVEQITNQGADADKLYWNVALGIDASSSQV